MRGSFLFAKISVSITRRFGVALSYFHSGEGRNPAISRLSGCRIKSGMTQKVHL